MSGRSTNRRPAGRTVRSPDGDDQGAGGGCGLQPARTGYAIQRRTDPRIAERSRYPALELIAGHIGATCTVIELPIPVDCVDGFTEAYYGRPERFLDPAVRRA